MRHALNNGPRSCRLLAAAALLVLTATACQKTGEHGHGTVDPLPPVEDVDDSGPDGTVIDQPRMDVGITTLADRAATQVANADQIKVPHDFRLQDRQPESGIGFRHQIVVEAGKDWKPVHYDHGSAVAAADVDGDGLPDLYFVSLIGGNQLWRNLGGGTFEDITDRAGVAVDGVVSMAASFADYDNDGDADLFVTTIRRGNRLFQNDGHGVFEEVAAKVGLDYEGHSSTGTFFDWDRDGDLDLFLANVGRFTTDETWPDGYYKAMADAFDGHLYPERTEASILYRNDGGQFSDASAAAGLVDTSWSGDAGFADLAGDGYPDLYVLNMQGDNHFYDNDGGRFSDRTASMFPKTPWGAMGIKFFDHDNDRDLDLMVTDMHSDMSAEQPPNREKRKSYMTWDDLYLQDGSNNIFGNAFWRNEGGGTFEEVSDVLGTENYWPWGVSVSDINADGWPDAFISASMSYPHRYGINSLLLNNAGQAFIDSEFLLGIEPRRDGRAKIPWYTLDCDNADASHDMCQDHSGSWTVNGNLGTRGSVILDLDGDGDIDIVTNEFNAEPQVLLSDLAERRSIHWLSLRLRGTVSNRDGLGAVVRVITGERTQTQQVDGKAGYMAQSSLPLYFGLGDATQIDKIEIDWPSGSRQVVEDGLEPDRAIEIEEPGG